jgi:hypothetical protein
MRSFLINKNLSLYYQLRRTIGRKAALKVARVIEKTVLILGREPIPNERVGMSRRMKH